MSDTFVIYYIFGNYGFANPSSTMSIKHGNSLVFGENSITFVVCMKNALRVFVWFNKRESGNYLRAAIIFVQ